MRFNHDNGMFETMETLLHGPIGGGPAAPDGSPHCNPSNAAGRTGAQGGNQRPQELSGPPGPMRFTCSTSASQRCRELWFANCRKLLVGCLGALVNVSDVLDRSGFVARPTWEELRVGARPPLLPERAEPGEWQHGWQYHASSSSELHFRETWVLAQSCPADQAHLRSHSGPASCAVYTELQQDQSSNWHRISSGRLCWSKCPRPIVNAGRLGTSKVGTVRHVHGPEGCSPEHRLLNGLSPVCAAKQGQRASTQCCGT